MQTKKYDIKVAFENGNKITSNTLSDADFYEILKKAFQYLRAFASAMTNEHDDSLEPFLNQPEQIKLKLTSLTRNSFNLLTLRCSPEIYCSQTNPEVFYCLDEPYTKKILFQYFDKQCVCRKFLSYFSNKQMNIKGSYFERICLLHFIDIGKLKLKLTELPFIKKAQCSSKLSGFQDLIFTIDKFQDYSTITEDNSYFEKPTPNTLVSPSNFAGPDGILFLQQEKMKLFILFGMKYSSNSITSSVSFDNDIATSINCKDIPIIRILLEYEDNPKNSSNCHSEDNIITITLKTSDIIDLFNLTNNKDDSVFASNLKALINYNNPQIEITPTKTIENKYQNVRRSERLQNQKDNQQNNESKQNSKGNNESKFKRRRKSVNEKVNGRKSKKNKSN